MDAHAQALAAATARKLVNDYGFPAARAEEAVNAIGDKGDVQMAISWLLDHGEEDRGGAVTLTRCPHIDYIDCQSKLAAPSALRFGQPCKEGCRGGECWVNLFSGETRCSRYVNSHCLANWRATREAAEKELTVADAAAGKEALGHHLAVSESDLSVWCYACEAYIEHEAVEPHVEALRALKFGTKPASSSEGAASSADGAGGGAAVKVGDPLECDRRAMHGSCGAAVGAARSGRFSGEPWAAPVCAAACDAAARPGYRTCAAHEYKDTPEVLQAKVGMLVDMLRAAKHAVAYTGAGISTASGIKDYATKTASLAHGGRDAQESAALLLQKQARGEGSSSSSPLEAQPTLAHHALTALHAAGRLAGGWVQQNHDGLPQKAGFPQAALNEIHGAWFDPSNPVVPMDGTLRSDLIEALAETEARADLAIVLGTSLCGMNADRIASTPALRARRGEGVQGTCIINLQRTIMDEHCQLRIFATCDEVLAAVTAALGVTVAPALPAPPSGEVFEQLRYDAATGARLPVGSPTMTLDLRAGAKVRIVNQPDWDAERCGTTATVIGRDPHGHWVVELPFGGGRKQRTLGAWWIRAALEGSVPSLPLVNAAADAEGNATGHA